MFQALWTSWDPEACVQRLVFLLCLLNLESGIMSLKLVLMIQFIPVMESTLHHGHWNTEGSSCPSARSLVISPFLDHFSYSSMFHVHSYTRAGETKRVSSPQQAVNGITGRNFAFALLMVEVFKPMHC